MIRSLAAALLLTASPAALAQQLPRTVVPVAYVAAVNALVMEELDATPLRRRLGIGHERIVYTLAKHGNTSAASIPLALNQAFEDHRLIEGRLVLMEAMGGGLTWGAALARW